MNNIWIKKFLFIISATIVIFLIYYLVQPVGSYHLEQRMDGNQYAKVFYYFKGLNPGYNVKFPFHSRVLVPYLASLTSLSNPIPSFQLFNFIFSVLTIACLIRAWTKLKIPDYLIFIGFFWLAMHWSGIVRLNAFDPITVDVAVYFFQALLLLVVITKKWAHFLWIGPLATLTKEHFPIFFIVIFFYLLFEKDLINKKEPLLIVFSSFTISILTKVVVNHFFPHAATNDGSAFHTFFKIFYITLNHPTRLIRWLVAVITAYGFFIFAIAGNYAKKIDLIFLLSITSLALSFWGGADFTRLAFLGFPFIMTLILQNLEGHTLKSAIVLLILSVPFMGLFWQIPDPAKDWLSFISWYPEYAKPLVVFYWGLYIALVSSLILYCYIKHKHLLLKKN